MGKEIHKGLELHQLILIGDDIALSKLYDLYGEEIAKKLKTWYSLAARIDVSLIYTAVNEAFWGYFRNPLTFNPEKSNLLRFLEIAAERDLQNILAKEEKYLIAKKAPADVELEEIFWNSLIQDHTSADGELIINEMMAQVNGILGNYFRTDQDIKLAKLVISQERETKYFALILQIEDWSNEEQKMEVKRHKDRIKKTLERHLVIEQLKRLIQ